MTATATRARFGSVSWLQVDVFGDDGRQATRYSAANLTEAKKIVKAKFGITTIKTR